MIKIAIPNIKCLYTDFKGTASISIFKDLKEKH